MDKKDHTNHQDEPSLGDDILEQMRAQEEPSAAPQGEASSSQPEEEEAWWLKYVQDSEVDPDPEPESSEGESPGVETHSVPSETEESKVPPPGQDKIVGVSPALREDNSSEKLEKGNDSSNKAKFLSIELPPSPPPPEITEVPSTLPPVPSQAAVVPSAAPQSHSRPQTGQGVSAKKPSPGRAEKAAAREKVDAISYLNRGVKRVTPRLKSILRLWPFTLGALGLIAAIIFVPFTFVPDIIVEGKVEEEEQALFAAYTGKVETVFVRQWDRVQAGEPLVQLQSDQLEEEMEGLTTKLQMRYENSFEEYQDEIEKLNRTIVKAEIDYKALISENEVINRQIQNLNAILSNKEEGEERDPDEAKKEGILERISVLSADYAKNESRITKVSGELAAAESDIGKLMVKVRELQEKESLDLANLEEESKYRNLLGKRDQLILKAPVTGSVSELPFKEGQAVREGDAILRIVSDPDRIKIRIPEERIKDYTVGDSVWIKDGVEKQDFLKVPITLMSPKINSEDASLEPGRSVFLSYPSGSALLPGQKVLVHLNNPDETGLQSVHRKISRRFEYAKRRDQESRSDSVVQ